MEALHLGQDVDVQVLEQRLLCHSSRGIIRVVASVEHQRNGSGLAAISRRHCSYRSHHRLVTAQVAGYVLLNVRCL